MYDRKERIVIVGGGFGGLAAAKALAKANVHVTLVDRRNHHLFQPLLYQVATGAVNASEIASPLRHLLRRQTNCDVVLREMTGLDAAAHEVMFADGTRLPYDKLIIAAGSRYNYFGNDQWEQAAPSLKTVEDALEIRSRILTAFEQAENNPELAHEILNFVIIGGGPTGVELAGQIAELARKGLRGNFHRIDPTQARVMILDAGPKALAPMGDNLSQHGERQLRELGIELRFGQPVRAIEADHVMFGDERIPTRTVLWCAGVMAPALAGMIAKDIGVEQGPGGRLMVDDHCRLLGAKDVYVIGDICAVKDMPLPGLATVAMQMGRYVAGQIAGKTDAPFAYHDKGTLAVIGRNRAVGKVGRFEIHGFTAWALWLLIHVRYLAGLQNRLTVMARWIVSYLTFSRSGRLITQSGWEPAAAPNTERELALH
jgi:NADH dehydrogenase